MSDPALNSVPVLGLDVVSHRILSAHAEEAVARLTAAEVISHAGERGIAREEILRQYLREIVPRGFEVTTGFVIDSAGGQSLQQDLVIVRRDFHPSFQIGGARFFPVEAVSAVVEVKSTLDSSTLSSAIKNARSVKVLDRTGGGRAPGRRSRPSTAPRTSAGPRRPRSRTSARSRHQRRARPRTRCRASARRTAPHRRAAPRLRSSIVRCCGA